MTTTPWIKAKKSGGNGGSCVEARRNGANIEVRDSKNPEGASLSFTKAEWDAFLDGAGNGEFHSLLND